MKIQRNNGFAPLDVGLKLPIGAEITPGIRSGFMGIFTGPETISLGMSGGPTDLLKNDSRTR